MLAQSRTRRPLVVGSVMAAMFMVAIEATIISTAMPQIVGQLGGLHLYSWVFSSFLLAQTTTTVVFGKLSDVYGRKPVILAGIGIFLVGSLLCGFAWSMPSLVAFRLVQGIGAGAIQPVCLTIVGDLFAARERGKVQGFLASVWGVSAVTGPLAGGLIIAHFSWPWVFWMNLPVGVLAACGFVLFLREERPPEEHRLDIAGALLFTMAGASLMVALTEIGGSSPLWAFPPALVFVASAAALFWQERRASEPMIALDIWGQRPIATANGATLLAGMALIGLTTFLPMYVQGVLGRPAVVAGLALTMTLVGWPIGATFAARSLPRLGLHPILLAGSALMPLGAMAFISLQPSSSPVVAGVGSFVMGLGMGLVSTSSIVLIQEIVPWAKRGSATASNVFSRNLGSTLGAAVLGAILNIALSHKMGARAVTSEDLRRLIETQSASVADVALRTALQEALHLTFWGILMVSLGIVVLAWLVPVVDLRRTPTPTE